VEKVRFGIIGCGNISAQYFTASAKLPVLECVACADINPDAAKAAGEKYNVAKVLTPTELMHDPSVEIVLNLTIPKAHAQVTLSAIEAGKHVYLEKPLGVNRTEGHQILAASRAKGVRVGCAPDTFLGAGLQTARKFIDDGAIGTPTGFQSIFMGSGPEAWHPNPEFVYEIGGGPMFDMGPYYLTALLNLFGPAKRISGMANIGFKERFVGSGPKKGKKLPVETPDQIFGLVEFENGALGTLATTLTAKYSVHDWTNPITVWGTEGAMKVPDPNSFDGPVFIATAATEGKWQELPSAFVTGYGRSIGLADMAVAIRRDRPHRASAEQAALVLDLMQGFLDSSTTGEIHEPTVKYQRPAPMPAQLPFGELD
jgi:predicted dehydrogenase